MKVLDSILKVCAIFSFVGMIFVVLTQILTRYVPVSFVWTEEITRFLFIFSILFSAPLAMKKREYISVDLFIDFLPGKLRKIYKGFIYLVLALFCAFLLVPSYDFAMLGKGQTSATLKIEMFYIYLGIGVALLFLCVYSIVNAVSLFRGNDVEKKGVEK